MGLIGRVARCWFVVGMSALCFSQARTPPAVATPMPAGTLSLRLGQASVPLNGPWSFHAGDDPRWADPAFDDSGWETIDLTPAPGAHDPDVGLSGYVPGWTTKGHPGVVGYAWYRIRVQAESTAGEPLAVAGPPLFESAYQLFADGRLLGGSGDFTGVKPRVYGFQPRVFPLAPRANGLPTVLALRVWMFGATAPPGSGGIHIAPALGTAAGIDALALRQWLEMIRGYVLEFMLFLIGALLAFFAGCLALSDRRDPFYRWLVLALLVTGLSRGQQAFFFWFQFESLYPYAFVRQVLLTPLAFLAWTMAWWLWFRGPRGRWLPRAAVLLGVVYLVAQIVVRPWLVPFTPQVMIGPLNLLMSGVRLAFVALFLFLLLRGVRRGRVDLLAVAGVLFTGGALFASELSSLNVPGIWFPFQMGVSRTQYAILALDAVVFALLVQRFMGLARGPRPVAAGLAPEAPVP